MNMQCHDAELLLVDYIDGHLQNGEKKALEKHLAACERCSAELAQYRELFNSIATHNVARPGPLLKENFNTMLQSELNIQATTSIIGKEERPEKAKVFSLTGLLSKAAAAVVLLASGVLIGSLFQRNTAAPATGSEMAELKSEVKEMKAALMFNLLNDASASERIKAVSYTEEMNNPDQDVIRALVNTLNADNNVNVRLAALNSISRFSSNPQVRDSLVNSLKVQKEPLVQIVLINILADKKEQKAIEPIKAIISNKETIQPVKEAAERGLKVL